MSVDKRQASVAMCACFQSYLISQHENIYIYEKDISFIIKISYQNESLFCIIGFELFWFCELYILRQWWWRFGSVNPFGFLANDTYTLGFIYFSCSRSKKIRFLSIISVFMI